MNGAWAAGVWAVGVWAVGVWGDSAAEPPTAVVALMIVPYENRTGVAESELAVIIVPQEDRTLTVQI